MSEHYCLVIVGPVAGTSSGDLVVLMERLKAVLADRHGLTVTLHVREAAERILAAAGGGDEDAHPLSRHGGSG